MGRRNLENIDRKIIKQTIKLGALNGLDHISTIELASKLSISEGTIFVHFKTKDNLVLEAYNYIKNMVQPYVKKVVYDAETEEELFGAWIEFVDVLSKNSDYSLFMYKFFNSKIFTKYIFNEPEYINEFIEKWLKKAGNENIERGHAVIIWNDIAYDTLRYIIYESSIKDEIIKQYQHKAFKTIFAPLFIKY